MVVDPFKLDYSPAKIFVDSEEATLYKAEFQKASQAISNGCLPFEQAETGK
jgi:hypothetical protein